MPVYHPPAPEVVTKPARPSVTKGLIPPAVVGLLLMLLSLAFSQASTVTGNLKDTQGTALVGTNIVFAPLSTPQVENPFLIPSTDKTVTSGAGGAFSIVLEQGDYKVTIGGRARDSFIISVPNDAASYNISTLVSSALTYIYPFTPLYVLRTGDELSGSLSFDSNTNYAGIVLKQLTTVQRDALTATNGMLIYNATANQLQAYVNGAWAAVGGGGGGSGTVTSVALTPPAGVSVSGSPVTSSGTLALSWDAVAPHAFLVGPDTGGSAAPTFRLMSKTDLPSGIEPVLLSPGTVDGTEFGFLDGVTSAIQVQINGKAATAHNHSTADITSGTLGVARGGTGLAAFTAAGDLPVATATTTIDPLPIGTSGQVLTVDTSLPRKVKWASPAAGSGDVVGPASATDNAIARFDSTTGKLIQNSGATLADDGVITASALTISGSGPSDHAFSDSDGSHTVHVRAPPAITSTNMIQLPVDATSGVLVLDAVNAVTNQLRAAAFGVPNSGGVALAGGMLEAVVSDGSTARFFSFRRMISQVDEFMTAASASVIGDLSWVVSSSGTGSGFATAQHASNVHEHPGQVRIRCGTSASSYASMRKSAGSLTVNPGGGQIVWEKIVIFDQLDDGAANHITAQLGLQSGVTSTNSADGVYFRFGNNLHSGNWRGVSREDLAETMDSAVASVACTVDTWYHLAIVINAAATAVEWYVNGTLIGTASTNVPDSNDPLLESCSVYSQGTLTANVDMYVDAYRFKQLLTNGRGF